MIDDCIKRGVKNQTISENLIRAYSIINKPEYQKIVCSVSGGADSDVMLDICYRCDKDKKIDYVWFNTGLEYQATKDHLKYLENKYAIEIKRYNAVKPIPLVSKQYGQPFASKYASEMIERLQKHNFKWEDKSFDELYKEYPNCKGALMWFCNQSPNNSFNIRHNSWLKEFMLQNPPTFDISNKCCKYAKKDTSSKALKEINGDLVILGIRKYEGGIRSRAYKNCYDEKNNDTDQYRPLFWYKDEDKSDYEEYFNVTNSNCYTEYGLKRTGCCGCVYSGSRLQNELDITEKYEPKLYKAVCNVFKDTYEYTKKYYEFRDKMNSIYGSYAKYLREMK